MCAQLCVIDWLLNRDFSNPNMEQLQMRDADLVRVFRLCKRPQQKLYRNRNAIVKSI